jgi:diphthine synthase
VIVADREMVESDSDEILRDADKEDVAFLVVGDQYGYAYLPSLPRGPID